MIGKRKKKKNFEKQTHTKERKRGSNTKAHHNYSQKP